MGGGSVGCAIAYALSRYDLKVAVAEKELDVGMGASGRNSGVVHAGFNNRPGSLMAKLCVEGNEGFEALCKMLDIPYKRTGKLIVGYDEADHQALTYKFILGILHLNMVASIRRINVSSIATVIDQTSPIPLTII